MLKILSVNLVICVKIPFHVHQKNCYINNFIPTATSFFQSIPAEIEEAAWIDGCSRFKTLRTVVLPLALPGIVTAFIFTFIAAWNEFVVALTLTSTPAREPLTVGLTSLIGQYEVQWNFLFAGSLIAIVPVVILFALIEKWLVGGLTAGSVK